MTILVTGATGAVGRALVAALLGRGVPVRALTRDAAARLPEGVEMACGDLARPETLAPALRGVERMYLFPVPETAAEVVGLAKRAGVGRIVTHSCASAMHEDRHDPNGQYLLRVERAVEASGLEWTHLRPFGYMKNALAWAAAVRDEGVVRAPYGGAAYPHVHEADVADVAAAVLLGDGHIGQRLVLTGPESITQVAQVQAIGAAVGREVGFEELTEAEARRLWSASMTEESIYVELFVLAQAARTPFRPKPTVEAVTGRRGRTFAQWAVEHADAFR